MISNRPCPICSVSNGKLIVESNQNPQNISGKELGNLFVGLRANQSFFPYLRCKECQLCYNSNYFSQDALAKLYRNMPPNLVFDEERNVKETHKSYADYIISNHEHSESLIELGADSGFVTEKIISKFSINKGTIIEPNLEVRPVLETILMGRDFEIVNYLDDSKLNGQYDLFIAVHVLDHLLNPYSDLLKINKSMKIGGKAFIVIHNQKSFLAKILGKKWPPYCLQHPQIFDMKSIEILLSRVGFSDVKISRTKNRVSIKNLISMLFEILRIPSFLLRFVPDFTIPIYFGNIIVSAKK
jgi:phospholipid N-methyltransferase